MTLVYAALLGVVQGLTEFLPVSSSAHLILGRAVLGWDADALGLPFDVACHVGTLLAVAVYFANDLLAMVAAIPRLLSQDAAARRARLIAAGTIPVVLVGLTLADVIEDRLRTPVVCILTLALGAIALLVVERLGPRRRRESNMTYGDAISMGVAQAAALVPGVSRSGATITLGMFCGLRREDAARFSFLLGVPAIIAAAAKEGLHLVKTGLAPDVMPVFAVGIVASGVVGYLTVKYFLRFLVTHRLDVFAWYRLALAGVAASWLVVR